VSMTANPAVRPPGFDDAQWQERRLGRTILRTFRTTVDIDDVVPNPMQPRSGPKEDLELQRQIEANEGIFEPLLLEPHPDLEGKYRIVDGDRRWSNSRVLVDTHKKEQYRRLPAEVTNRTLTDDERFRVWIYIHRQRKEWDAKEKEMVAYRLVDLVGRASAANILGVTVRELDKLVEIYELSEKLTKGLPDPATSITWAREIKNLNRKLLTPPVQNALIRKINNQEITNSKDVRKLRQILRDPVARDEFLSNRGTIESASLKLAPPPATKRPGLVGDIEAISEAIKSYSWKALAELKGDAEAERALEEAEKLLQELKATLKR
jgi:ParB family transcriptional regulator, chromosome partitioning protein